MIILEDSRFFLEKVKKKSISSLKFRNFFFKFSILQKPFFRKKLPQILLKIRSDKVQRTYISLILEHSRFLLKKFKKILFQVWKLKKIQGTFLYKFSMGIALKMKIDQIWRQFSYLFIPRRSEKIADDFLVKKINENSL